MPETCGPDNQPRGGFVEIKGISSRAEQENIYEILKTSLKVLDDETFKLAIIQQQEGILYNTRRDCDNHETLYERHGKVTSG